jgi:hypothetical protein
MSDEDPPPNTYKNVLISLKLASSLATWSSPQSIRALDLYLDFWSPVDTKLPAQSQTKRHKEETPDAIWMSLVVVSVGIRLKPRVCVHAYNPDKTVLRVQHPDKPQGETRKDRCRDLGVWATTEILETAHGGCTDHKAVPNAQRA